MRGRKPKPVAMQISEGDPAKRGKRKLQEKLAAEPAATKGLPECPEHLIGRAREAWDFFTEELSVMNIDNKPDAMMLEGACVNYSRAVQADLILESQGLIVEESTIDEDSGEKIVLKTKAHPAIAISAKCWTLTKSFCSEFGLSPVSRTRLTIEKKDKGAESLADMLSRPRTPRPEAIQ